ncbi:MAG: SDR family oxidoreductase [Candidatus Nitrosocosmicus sp.]
MINNKKVAVVTGSSTGIGYETCLSLAQNGYITYATMRDLKKSKKIEKIAHENNLSIKIVEMDVDKDESVKKAIENIIDKNGQIDILVNNAGYGLFGALEDITLSEIKNQFETNVFGVIRVTQNVLPMMRSQRNGIIINISSISGLVGIPCQSVYVATKFAVEGLSESISYELEPLGIKVILIEPGPINTEFVQDLIVPINRYEIDKNRNETDKDKFKDNTLLSPYNNTIKKFLSFYYNAMINAPYPGIVADTIIQSIEKVSMEKNDSNLLRVTVGEDSEKYSKLKKELKDHEFYKTIKEDLLK